jgi:hypothetical protein
MQGEVQPLYASAAAVGGDIHLVKRSHSLRSTDILVRAEGLDIPVQATKGVFVMLTVSRAGVKRKLRITSSEYDAEIDALMILR